MKPIKKSLALALIHQAIADKGLRVGVKAYINGDYASIKDLKRLSYCVNKGEDKIYEAHKDNNGKWRFVYA